jgi:hypothetical protein
MNVNYDCKASDQSEKTLLALVSAVSNALDKKQKLGQYAVVWDRKKISRKKLRPSSMSA